MARQHWLLFLGLVVLALGAQAAGEGLDPAGLETERAKLAVESVKDDTKHVKATLDRIMVGDNAIEKATALHAKMDNGLKLTNTKKAARLAELTKVMKATLKASKKSVNTLRSKVIATGKKAHVQHVKAVHADFAAQKKYEKASKTAVREGAAKIKEMKRKKAQQSNVKEQNSKKKLRERVKKGASEAAVKSNAAKVESRKKATMEKTAKSEHDKSTMGTEKASKKLLHGRALERANKKAAAEKGVKESAAKTAQAERKKKLDIIKEKAAKKVAAKRKADEKVRKKKRKKAWANRKKAEAMRKSKREKGYKKRKEARDKANAIKAAELKSFVTKRNEKTVKVVKSEKTLKANLSAVSKEKEQKKFVAALEKKSKAGKKALARRERLRKKRETRRKLIKAKRLAKERVRKTRLREKAKKKADASKLERYKKGYMRKLERTQKKALAHHKNKLEKLKKKTKESWVKESKKRRLARKLKRDRAKKVAAARREKRAKAAKTKALKRKRQHGVLMRRRARVLKELKLKAGRLHERTKKAKARHKERKYKKEVKTKAAKREARKKRLERAKKAFVRHEKAKKREVAYKKKEKALKTHLRGIALAKAKAAAAREKAMKTTLKKEQHGKAKYRTGLRKCKAVKKKYVSLMNKGSAACNKKKGHAKDSCVSSLLKQRSKFYQKVQKMCVSALPEHKCRKVKNKYWKRVHRYSQKCTKLAGKMQAQKACVLRLQVYSAVWYRSVLKECSPQCQSARMSGTWKYQVARIKCMIHLPAKKKTCLSAAAAAHKAVSATAAYTCKMWGFKLIYERKLKAAKERGVKRIAKAKEHALKRKIERAAKVRLRGERLRKAKARAAEHKKKALLRQMEKRRKVVKKKELKRKALRAERARKKVKIAKERRAKHLAHLAKYNASLRKELAVKARALASINKCRRAKQTYFNLVKSKASLCARKGTAANACFTKLNVSKKTWYKKVTTTCKNSVTTAVCKKSKKTYYKYMHKGGAACKKQIGSAKIACVRSLKHRGEKLYYKVLGNCSRKCDLARLNGKNKIKSIKLSCNKYVASAKRTCLKTIKNKIWLVKRGMKKTCAAALKASVARGKAAATKRKAKCKNAKKSFFKHITARQTQCKKYASVSKKSACLKKLRSTRVTWYKAVTKACQWTYVPSKCRKAKKVYYGVMKKGSAACNKKSGFAKDTCILKLRASSFSYYKTVKHSCK